jgi:hypothetical protein
MGSNRKMVTGKLKINYKAQQYYLDQSTYEKSHEFRLIRPQAQHNNSD